MMGRHHRRLAMVVAAVVAFGTVDRAHAAEPEAAAPPSYAWPETPPPARPPSASPRPATERRQTDEDAVREVLRDHPEIGPRYRQGRGMVIGGAVSIGTAGGSLLIAGLWGLSGSFAASAPDAEPDAGQDERSIAIGFAVTAAALALIGVPLVAVGARRRGEAIADARRHVSLGLGPRGFGLRF